MSIRARIERVSQQQAESAPLERGSRELVRQRPPTMAAADALLPLKSKLLKNIIAELTPEQDAQDLGQLEQTVDELFDRFLEQEETILGKADRQRLHDQVMAEITGYGPLEPYLRDHTVDEIMVNGTETCYVERRGKLEEVPVHFESDSHVMRIIARIVSPLGRRVDETQPYVDARLPDGSRVNVIIPPLALNGPVMTIRKFAKSPYTVEDLIRMGTFTPEFAEFVKACVVAKLNVVISGGTGAGKTTLLNVLSAFIPNTQRIITIEDAAELQLRQRHVISLESRPKNIEGQGEVTRGDLVVNALRMRPDRIIVGECRSAEALDMLQAMNTGHEGSMTTVHANSPRDALHRVETMVLMAGYDLPLRAIREQISSALDVVIHIERSRDGVRRVVTVMEIQSMEGDVIVTQDVFRFERASSKDGQVVGTLKPTGIRPKFMEKIEAAGIFLMPSIFQERRV